MKRSSIQAETIFTLVNIYYLYVHCIYIYALCTISTSIGYLTRRRFCQTLKYYRGPFGRNEDFHARNEILKESKRKAFKKA